MQDQKKVYVSQIETLVDKLQVVMSERKYHLIKPIKEEIKKLLSLLV